MGGTLCDGPKVPLAHNVPRWKWMKLMMTMMMIVMIVVMMIIMIMTMTMTIEDPCTHTNGWVFGETPKGVGVISNLKISIHFPNKGAGGGGGGGIKGCLAFFQNIIQFCGYRSPLVGSICVIPLKMNETDEDIGDKCNSQPKLKQFHNFYFFHHQLYFQDGKFAYGWLLLLFKYSNMQPILE